MIQFYSELQRIPGSSLLPPVHAHTSVRWSLAEPLEAGGMGIPLRQSRRCGGGGMKATVPSGPDRQLLGERGLREEPPSNTPQSQEM